MRNSEKRECKKNKITKKRTLESHNVDDETAESLADILREELGEDKDTLSLIKQVLKQEAYIEDESEDSRNIKKDQTDYRRCPACGLDSLFINNICSECGHKLTRREINDKIDSEDANPPTEDEE